MRITSRLGAATVTAAVLTSALAGATVAQDVEGSVDVHGSSTVAPISLAVSEAFAAANPDFGYVVGEEGTGDGFTQFFCADGRDISDASRTIKEDEAALCAENGVEYAELKVGYDGIAVITSPENPIECLNQVRPVGALRRRVERHHDVAGRRGLRPRDGLDHRPSRMATSPSRRRATSPAPTTRSSSSPSAPAAEERGVERGDPRPGAARPTSAPPTTSSSSRASRSSRPPSASWAWPTPRTPATPSRSSRSTRARAAWPPARRRVATAPTP